MSSHVLSMINQKRRLRVTSEVTKTEALNLVEHLKGCPEYMLTYPEEVILKLGEELTKLEADVERYKEYCATMSGDFS